jgi:hypothetical protein
MMCLAAGTLIAPRRAAPAQAAWCAAV